ncbi:thioesterase-like superfamily-domain-containing protein [Podospora appendiculata]|uniref:Thioesterase-like superfamily-domain-containing protein n=1 Tax=Podospora appendiculata TaxID=314037 RepID=A0AAE0X0A6_9PEZI|nr:thioesterase-like superfamily-domain-containing protein [Podospora appendiculata]
MASDQATKSYVPFAEATKVERLDAHTYKVHLDERFCIGTVPNGGYTSSCLLAAARVHLAPRNQPDTLAAHFEYPNRAAVGPAIVAVDEVKLGRQLSTLHLTLWQGDGGGHGLLPVAPWVDPRAGARRVVLAYSTHANLRSLAGISLPTGYEEGSANAMPPAPGFVAGQGSGGDAEWVESKMPAGATAGYARSLDNWRFFVHRDAPLVPGVLDVWMRLASGERIAQAALPYVVDSFPWDMHVFLVARAVRGLFEAVPKEEKKRSRGKGVVVEGGQEEKEKEKEKGDNFSLWLPTVVMNLEVKAALPEEGVEWLAVRITSKQIKDGRFDLEVIVRDVEGELVALGQQVALIVERARNMAGRGGEEDGGSSSKL